MRVSAEGCVSLFKHTDLPISSTLWQKRFTMLSRNYQLLKRFHPRCSSSSFPPNWSFDGKSFVLNLVPIHAGLFLSHQSSPCQVSTLVHTDPTTRISISVDSSGSHVGAVLQQEIAGSWASLYFFSRKLSSVESRISAFYRELLAAYSAIPHFWFLLDHKPLIHAFFIALVHHADFQV